jgi:hypothetical protein
MQTDMRRAREETDEVNEKEFLLYAERDAYVIDAILRAAHSMTLVDGAAISLDGVGGTIHFETEIYRLCTALVMLGYTPASELER